MPAQRQEDFPVTAPAGKGRSRPARKKADRRPLSHRDIVDAALKLIDSEGLENLTMRSLAQAMGVYPATLYWHAGSKAEVVAAVAGRVFDEVVLPDEHQVGWDEWLADVANRCRVAMHRHPEIARIAGSQMVVSTTALPMVERIVGVLERAGFTGADLVHAHNALTGFILGWTTLELSAEPSGVDVSWKDEFAGQLHALDANAYPSLKRNMQQMDNHAFMTRYDSGRTHPMDDSFQAALKILLAGLRFQLAAAKSEQ
jgi:AcrR family transcriptional regulator